MGGKKKENILNGAFLYFRKISQPENLDLTWKLNVEKKSQDENAHKMKTI